MKRLFFLVPALILLTGACSTRKPSVLSNNYHALTARYNVLFNGNEALQKGVDELRRKAEEDFYREFPLEGIQFDDKVLAPGQSRSQDIQKAEEKAAKAVQKHSIEYRGVEYNREMDRAFLLLGQGRYYDQRYLAALDAFNYALTNFYDSDLRNELRLWRAKTRLRMGQKSLARRELAAVINAEPKRSDTRALAYAFMSESMRGDTLEEPVGVWLSRAARAARSRRLKIRLAYKAAQVWEKLGRKDSAVAMTDLILKRRDPEYFYLKTLWYRMHLTREDTALQPKYIKRLNSYFKNYYFHRYYPDIHFRLGELYETRGDTALAVKHYGQATASPVKSLQRLAYSKLADIYWDRSDYVNAGAYLDSLLSVTDKNKLEYLLIGQRRRSIDQIVHWEKLIRRSDSLIALSRLDTAEQRRRILAYIRRLQAEEAARARKRMQAARQGEGESAGNFYFYNQKQVATGKEQFRQQWGDRRLEDLWRLTNKYGHFSEEEVKEEPSGEQAKAGEQTAKQELPDKYSPEYYLRQIPRTEAQRDSLRHQILQAHLYLGLNYADDKLKEYGLARAHLQKVLDARPDDEMRSRAWYLLYKIAKREHKEDEAGHYAALLRKNYPESPYTQYILHPESFSDSSSKQFYADFMQAYDLFQSGEWTRARRLTDSLINRYANHPERAKLYLLLARISGKTDGIDAYIQTLKKVEKTFAGSPYAKQAESERKKLEMLKNRYGPEHPEQFPFFLVFRVARGDSLAVRSLDKCLNAIYTETESKPRKIFTDQYDDGTWFVVVHDFLSRTSAEYILEKMREKRCAIPSNFIISRGNYIHLQLTKQINSTGHVRKKREENNRGQRNGIQTTQPAGNQHQGNR